MRSRKYISRGRLDIAHFWIEQRCCEVVQISQGIATTDLRQGDRLHNIPEYSCETSIKIGTQLPELSQKIPWVFSMTQCKIRYRAHRVADEPLMVV